MQTADEKAVRRGVRRVFNNSGQSCNAPTRLLVEKSIYDRAVKEAIEVAEKTDVDIASIKKVDILDLSFQKYNMIKFKI